ncbi:MAG: hypothetical protein AB3N28_03785 [Kordiimonas sp.]
MNTKRSKSAAVVLTVALSLTACKPIELSGSICEPIRFNGQGGKTIDEVGAIDPASPAGIVDLKEDNKPHGNGGFIYHCRKEGSATFKVTALVGSKQKHLSFKVNCS